MKMPIYSLGKYYKRIKYDRKIFLKKKITRGTLFSKNAEKKYRKIKPVPISFQVPRNELL